MTTKKFAKKLNADFPQLCNKDFEEKFSVEITTSFNIFSMQMVSRRVDEKDFTKEQFHWLQGFSDGFARAMKLAEAAQ